MTVEDPTKKQIQEVDPEVAKILGLEDNFDLEYDEYLTLLKEALVKYAVIGKEKDSAEKAQVLNEERKRIKGLKGSKFTAPKKAVNTDSFFGRKKEETTQKPITDTAKLLPGTVGAGPIQKYKSPEEPKQEEEKKDDTSDKLKEIDNFLNGSLLGIVKEIRGLTEDILSILQKQFSAEKKGAELFRRESEKKGKVGKEKELETKEEKKGLGLVEKITKPFTSIFDTIKNFITMVLLGSLVNWLFSVIENPMILLKPIQGLIDGIVGFFNNIINFIDNLVVQPVRNFIDTINSALNGFIDILNGALKMLPGSPQIGPANIPNIPEPPQIEAPNITGEKKPAEPPKGPPVNLKFTGGSIGPTTQVIQKITGGLIRPIGPTTQVIQKNSGGGIANKDSWSFNDKVSKEGGKVNSSTTAFNITGLGPDKYLTALGEREYVLKPGAADWLGGPAELDPLNARFGGSSARKTANLGDVKITAMNSGGQVGRPPSSGSSSNDGSFKIGNKTFSPTQYTQNTKTTNHIAVGKNPPKSYVLRYQRQGNSANYTIKQINKVVAGAGFTRLFGGSDALTGVLPSSPEGKSILNSANVLDYFNRNLAIEDNRGVTADDLSKIKPSSKIKLQLDEDADIFYWYNQAYQTHYNDWRKRGQNDKNARTMAASAAAEFAISKSKGSWLPGSKPGAPEGYQNITVESGNTSNTPSSDNSNQSSQPELSEADLSFSIKGDPAKESYVQYLKSESSSSTPAPAAAPAAAPKGGAGESMMDVRRRNAAAVSQRESSRQRERLGVKLVNGKWVNTGVTASAVQNNWWQIWNKKGAKEDKRKKQEALAKSLANRLNIQEGRNPPNSAAATTPTPGRSVYKTPISGASSLSPSQPSTSTSSATLSATSTPVANKIAGGMEIYNKQKTSGDIKGAQDTAKSVWALANPTIAAAATERERTRGTQQTDNPLMKGMKSKLPMNSPSVQSADVAKLGSGFQSLVQNPNAFKAADSKSKEPNSSRTLIRAAEQPKANPPSPLTLPPAGPASSSQPITPLVPPAPTLPPPTQLNQDLNQMSIEQLSKMLDPTVTGASNPAVFQAATKAREEGKAQGLMGEALEKKVLIATIQAKQGSLSPATAPTAVSSPIAPSNITATTKPNIPQPPSTQPNVSMMPLPSMGQGGKPQSTGMTKTGTTPVVYFNSYNNSESVIVTTATLYNIWGM